MRFPGTTRRLLRIKEEQLELPVYREDEQPTGLGLVIGLILCIGLIIGVFYFK